ncbi:MAG: dynamin family protein, partial [Bacilli bacterium]
FLLSNVDPRFDGAYEAFVAHLYKKQGQLAPQLEQHTDQAADWLASAVLQVATERREQLQLNRSRLQQEAERQQEESAKVEENRAFRSLTVGQLQDKIAAYVRDSNMFRFEMRERVNAYLETFQPNYKVGWFSSEKKVAAVRAERKAVMVQELTTYVASVVDVQVYDVVLGFFRDYERITAGQRMKRANVDVESELEQIIDSAPTQVVSADGLLRYCDGIVEAVVRLYRRAYEVPFESYVETVCANLADLVEQNTPIVQAAIEQSERQITTLSELLETLNDHTENTIEIGQRSIVEMIEGALKAEVTTVEEEIIIQTPSVYTPTAQQLVTTIDEVQETIAPFAQFTGFAEELVKLRRQTAERTYYVTLFGAFSAGKSSFVNALLGYRLLPVSPHPTTATIIEITAPSGALQHLEASVTFKSESALREELQSLAQQYAPQTSTDGTLSEVCDRLITAFEAAGRRVQRHYVASVKLGLASWQSKLGVTERFAHADAYEMARTERTACVVQKIEMAFDHAYTRNGMVFVDTPGADSMNVRHTEVAYRYMVQADVILFVTYYNHAFNATDRHLL